MPKKISDKEYSNTTGASPKLVKVHHNKVHSYSYSKRKTPSQCILQYLFAQFVKSAEVKINEALNHSLDREVDMAVGVREGDDPAFDKLLYSLGSVSKHCPRSMIDAIMTWRKARSDSSDLMKLAEIQSGYPYPDMKIKEIMKERRSLISNFILCRVLIEITKQLQPEQLPEELGDKLEDMVFSQFKNLDPESISRSINRQTNADFFAELIGVISNIRFASVSDKFKSELTKAVNVMKESKVELLIHSMRFLKLKLYPMEALEDTAEFLQVCSNFFQSAHSIKVKHAYAEVFVELLDPIAAVAVAEVNLPMWTKSIGLIYPKATKMINKPRHYQVAYPLVTTLLCVSRKDFFLNNWIPQLELCFHKFKDKSLKHVALSCVTRLLWVYLYRCSDSSTSNCQKRLDSILKVLFPVNRKIITPSETSLNLFVQIVYFITAKHLEYGLNNVILMLLNCESGITSFSGGSSSVEKYLNLSGGVAGTIGTSLSQVYGGVSNNFMVDDNFSTTGSSSSFQATTSSSVIPSETDIAPERIIIGIRAFLLILSDLEEVVLQDHSSNPSSYLPVSKSMPSNLTLSSQVVVEGKINIPPPPFPTSALINKSSREERTASTGGYEELRKNQKLLNNDTPLGNLGAKPEYSINNVISSKVIARFGISVRDAIDRVNEVIGRLALSLEQSCGSYLITDERFYSFSIPVLNSTSSSTVTARRPASSVNGEGRNSNEGLNNTIDSQSQILPGGTAPISTTTSHFSVSKERHMLFYLTKTYLNALPRCTPTGVGSTWMLETIVKYVYHIDEGIRMAATEALKRIAKIKDENAKRWWLDTPKKHGSLIKKIMGLFESSLIVYYERFPEILVNSVNDSNEGYGGYNLNSINKLFVELLEILLEDAKKDNSDYTNEELVNLIGKIEGRGLLLLSSCLPNVRKRGIEIIKLSHQFENIRREKFPENVTNKNDNNNVNGNINEDIDNKNNTNKSLNNINKNKEIKNNEEVKEPCSVLTLMENIGPELVKKHYHDPVLATSSRTEFHKFQQRQRQQSVLRELENKDSLLRVAESEEQNYIAIWTRCYPDLIRSCFNLCSPLTIANCLVNAGSRFFQLMPYITISLDQYQGKASNNTVKWSQSNNWNNVRPIVLLNVTNEMIDQWKFYLIYMASTIEVWNPLRCTIPQVMALRKQTEDNGSKKINVTRAEQLFKHIAPLLSCEKITIRQSAVLAFGCINSLSYKTLLEILQPYIKNVLDDVRTKYPLDPKTYSSIRRNSTNTYQGKRLERLRMELAHIFSLIADFITYEQCRNNDKIMDSVKTYIIEMIKFLSDNYIQFEWDHQMLRYYFCGFIERLYDNLVITITNLKTAQSESKTEPERLQIEIKIKRLRSFMNFDTRYQLFKLFENWCGYGQLSSSTRDREARMMMSVLSQVKDGREKGALTTTMEEQRKALEMAALKAMSCLCKGEIIDSQSNASFDLNSLFFWIDSIFSSPDEKFHVISKSSLKSLLIYNADQPTLLESIIRKCYTSIGNTNISQGYFTAIVQIFYTIDDYPCKLNQMLTLTLYKISDPDISIRRNAMQLLKVLESRFLNVNWVEEFESAIGLSSLPIIFKSAQLAISSRLAKLLPHLTCEMISEITYCIELVSSFEMSNYPYSDIRNMFDFLLPWVRNINLTNEKDEEIFSKKYQVVQVQQRINTKRHPILSNSDVMLTNLFYLTIKFGNDYYSEMEQIWSNLIDMDGGPQDIQNPQVFNDNLNKNISIIIDFLLSIGVRKRNPAFVLYSKKIIVYISRTYACKNLIDTLIGNITPITLIPDMGNSTNNSSSNINSINDNNKSSINIFNSNVVIENINEKNGKMPLFVADLDNVLLEMPKRPAFSKGQLAAVLFVDAAIEIGNILLPNLPILLHVIIVQLDHFITLICEQSRLLLLNLIQGILPKSVRTEKVNSVISLLIEKEGKRMWSYEDVSGKNRNISSAKELSVFVEDLIEIFYNVDPNLRQTWGTLAIEWGTSCPVRHVACRSFQIFRTLMPMLNQKIMGNLFVRLSYTLGDVKEEIQGFAYEILITLNAMITSMSGEEILAFPQFFWACVAILYGPHEWEYLEGVIMLEKILNKVSLGDPKVSNILLINLPTRWKGQFTGLQALLLRGLNSSLTEKYSLSLINKIALLEQDDFVDKTNGRVLFSILANIPKLLQALEYSTKDKNNVTNFNNIKPEGQPHINSELNKENIDIDKCLEIAGSLAELAEMKNYTTIAKLMESYSKQRFRDFKDFLQKFINSIREIWFPTYELQTLQLLMGLLSNRNTGYRRMTLKVLKILLPYVNSRKQYSALEGIEEALVAPLLSLLRTELCNEALEVLDEAMKFTDCKRDVICIAEKHSLKNISSITQNINKEVDDSTGWSVSDPETASEYIKYNMAGVSFIGHSNQEIYSVFGKKPNQSSFDSNNDLQMLQAQEGQNETDEVNVINILDDLDEFFDELYENQNSDFQQEDIYTIQPYQEKDISYELSNNNIVSLSYSPIIKLLLSSPQIVKINIKLYKSYTDSNQAAIASLLISEFTTLLGISIDQFYISDYEDSPTSFNENTNINSIIVINFPSNERYNLAENIKHAETILNIISNINNPQLYQGVLTSIVDRSYQPKVIIEVQGFNMPYSPGDLNVNELSLLTNNYEVFQEINLTRHLSDEIKELRAVFRTFPISFQLTTDFYDELVQILKNYNDTYANTDDMSMSIEKLIENIQLVRNPTIYPLYWPPLTDIIVDNAKIENIATSFYQLQQEDNEITDIFIHHYSKQMININEQFQPYIIKRKEVLKLYQENDNSLIENMKLLVLKLMELFKSVLEFQGLLEQFLQITEDSRIHQLALIINCIDNINNLNNQ